MTVSEFIEKLKTFDQTLEIAIEWDYDWSNPDIITMQDDHFRKNKKVVVIDCNDYGTYSENHKEEK
jgi:hypothetical protein